MLNPNGHHSECGQDLWIIGLFGTAHHGTYLELGASHPQNGNNTLALEKLNWTGLSLEWRESESSSWYEVRHNPLLITDATQYPYESKLYDYISLDCDEQSNDCLKQLLRCEVKFRAMTIEHDRYGRGNGPADEQRAILKAAGYRLQHPDVQCCHGPYEDWWVA